jgi:hypothetical protein
MAISKNEEVSELQKYTKLIDRPGGKEKIKAFERDFLPYLGKKRELQQRKDGIPEYLWAWELFLLDRNTITYPPEGYGYTVVSPDMLNNYLEERKGLDMLNERREYARKNDLPS